ncbi:MAG TPA: amino acid permease [Candidatus Baltobacteraceae bacterium]|nr:amino acid permease [Candidatus Baltobacteraceae bacterium]
MALRQLFARQPLSWTPPDENQPRLRRALGWPALTAIGLGTMLGGIFPTIGAGAHAAGPAVILAYVLSGLVSVCVALCYAEFASMVPVAGSAYTYAYATLGELVAWIIGWDLILEYGLSVAPTASSWSDYFQHMLSNIGIAIPVWAQTAAPFAAHPQVDVPAALVTLAITALVAIGIRESASVNGALVVVQIIAMIVFIAVVAHAVRPQFLHPFAPFGWHGIVASTALVFFAYIGFDTVTVASEEAHRPERDVPIGIILALAIGGILYVALTICTVGVIPFMKLSDGAAMLDAYSAVSKNHAIYWIVALGGIAGNTTVMLTSLLGQIRIFYVMARDRLLPPGVAKVHHRFRTPARMTVITGSIVAVFAALFPLSDLLTLVNIGTLAAFAIVCLGVFALRFIAPDAPRPFRAPLVPLFSIAGAAVCFYLISGLEPATWIRYGVWFVVGVLVYAFYGFHKSRLKPGR